LILQMITLGKTSHFCKIFYLFNLLKRFLKTITETMQIIVIKRYRSYPGMFDEHLDGFFISIG